MLHVVTVFLLLTLVVVGEGFLLSNTPCVAPSPCTCSGNNINCNGKSLASVPTFSATTSKNHASSFNIRLNSNHLTSIPSQVFNNLSSVASDRFYFYLNDNKINRIDENAFAGIENKTYSLDLNNNKLTSLPTALGKLNILNAIHLSGNPITNLESPIMSLLGRSLTILDIDMQYFQSWPISLNMLSKLNRLSTLHIPFNHLPYNAFDGMSSTLTALTISKSKLYRIPPAVCHLHKLQSFNFDFNSALETNFSIFEPCSHPLQHVTKVSLQVDGLTSFPHVFTNFPSLQGLTLYANRISYVPLSAIPKNNSLTNLNFHANAVTRIPYAFNRLKHLYTLLIAGNRITTIEDGDISGLTSLRQLLLFSNPLTYISPNAFDSLNQLQSLNVENTKLTSIPEAVLSLTNLNSLAFARDYVSCSCDMSYLKGWNVTKVTQFTGNCYNQKDDSLKQYVLTSIPQCP